MYTQPFITQQEGKRSWVWNVKALLQATLRINCRQSECEDWIHSVRYIEWTQQYDAELEGLGWKLCTRLL